MTNAVDFELQLERMRRSFLLFVQILAPWIDTTIPHTRRMVEMLERFALTSYGLLLMSMPPRMGKSTMLQLLLAWVILREPKAKHIIAGYNQDLADSGSFKVRNLLQSERWPDPSIQIDTRKSGVQEWYTTRGGVIVARGALAGITGQSCSGLGLCDDLVSGPADVASPKFRDDQWDWFRSVFLSRRESEFGSGMGGRVCVTMTRWHYDDVYGRIKNSPEADQWAELCLPALAGDDDPLGRKPGEELWPLALGGPKLPSQESGDRSGPIWSSVYQQQPSTETDGAFEARFFENRYTEPASELRRHADHCLIAVDGASSETMSADYSVVAALFSIGPKIYLAEIRRGKWPLSGLEDVVKGMQAKWQPNVTVIEPASSGLALLQELRRQRLGFKLEEALMTFDYGGGKMLGKEARADIVRGLWEDGLVWLPATTESTQWVESFVSECLQAWKGKHDDQPDCVTHALRRLKWWMRKHENRDHDEPKRFYAAIDMSRDPVATGSSF